MTGLVAAYIQHFTYLGLLLTLVLCGFGLPVPEDVALLAGGYLVQRGVTELPMTLLVAFIGVVAGDNSLFFVGRRFGTGLVSYLQIGRPNSQRRIDRLKNFMDRHGNRAIFYARFVTGLRALVYLTAGSLGVSYDRFFLYDALGALISVPIMVSLGYLFGHQIQTVIDYLGGLDHLLAVAVLLIVAFYAGRLLMTSNLRAANPRSVDTTPEL